MVSSRNGHILCSGNIELIFSALSCVYSAIFVFQQKVVVSSLQCVTPRTAAHWLFQLLKCVDLDCIASNYPFCNFFYSEATSAGATRGLSANQKPIFKQRHERADYTGNCVIFRLVTFNPKFSTFEVAYS